MTKREPAILTTLFMFETDRRIFERLIEVGREPKVIYDIGASSAPWSVTVSRDLPEMECHLFEPLANLADYQCGLFLEIPHRPTWHVHPIALSDHNGSVTMNILADGLGADGKPYLGMRLVGSTILDRANSASEQLEVPCHRLDDYCADHGIPPPGVVKMDTQASESLIIKGGEKMIEAADVLIIESWLCRAFGPSTPLITDILDLLTPMGFILCELGDTYRSKGKLYHVDAVYAKEEVARLLFSD